MNNLHHIRRLYSLDTLDTRFTASKFSTLKDSVPGRQTTRSPGVASVGDSTTGEGTRKSEIASSLWATTEFYFYYVVFLVAIPLMFKVANKVSNRKFNPNTLE